MRANCALDQSISDKSINFNILIFSYFFIVNLLLYSLCYLGTHIICLLFVIIGYRVQKIREQECFHHCKHYKKFYQYYNPQCFTGFRQISKTIVIHLEKISQTYSFLHLIQSLYFFCKSIKDSINISYLFHIFYLMVYWYFQSSTIGKYIYRTIKQIAFFTTSGHTTTQKKTVTSCITASFIL